jgi:hypothetical protein
LGNSVPLVANRRTFVRFYVASVPRLPQNRVSVYLDVWMEGVYKGRLYPQNPDIPIRAWDLAANRADQDGAFYFDVPSDWLQPGTPLHMEAWVNMGSNSLAEQFTFDNVAEVYLPVQVTYPLCLHVVPVATSLPLNVNAMFWPNSPGFWDIVTLMQRMYPIADTGVQVRQGGFVFPIFGTWDLREENTWSTILGRLESYSSGYSDPPGCWELNYYGMVNPNLPLGGINGMARQPGNVAMGRMAADGRQPRPGGGNTMAHELGHNYGRSHVLCSGTEPRPCPWMPGAGDGPCPYPLPSTGIDLGYPYPGTNPCRIGAVLGAGGQPDPTSFYGFFPPITSTVILPTGAADLMSYGGPRWTSDYTYRALLNVLGQGGMGASGNRVAAPTVPLTATGEYVYVTGVITPDDSAAALGLFYRTDDPKPSLLQRSLDATLSASATMSLTLEDAGGTPLVAYPFEPSFATGDDGVVTETVTFAELLPWHPDTARIALYDDGELRAYRLVSANAPTVTILSPTGGKSFTNTLSVSWRAGDADADTLGYMVRYSPDDGVTWHVLVADWPSTTLTLPYLYGLPGSSQGRVQVIASDGVNTGQAVSAPFNLARHAPQAHIVEPETGSAFQRGQMVVLHGAALDAEDGMINNPAQMVWTSSLSGTLGSGPELWISTLPVGVHRITLTVADSDLITASDQIVVTVGHWVYLPVVLRKK